MTPQQFKAIRENLGLSKQELAEVLGVTLRSVQQSESGEKNVGPTVEVLMTVFSKFPQAIDIALDHQLRS